MVEHNLAKVGVASSSLVFRSLLSCWLFSLRRRAFFVCMYHADVRRPLYYGGIAQGRDSMRVLFVEHKCFVWIYATDVQCYILSCMNIRLVLSPAFMKDKVHLNIKIPNQRRKKIIPPLGRQGQDNIGGKTVTMCVPSCVPPPPRMRLLLCH